MNDTLVPGKKDRFVEPVIEQPIAMLFDDRNHLMGFTYPIVDKSKLEDKYHIKSDVWITKTDEGYFIADLKNSKWLYIEL